MSSGSSLSPDGMVSDLTSLFEAAGGYGANAGYNRLSGVNGNASNPGYGLASDGGTPSMDMVGGFGNEDELSKIMRDLF